jgi:Ca2+-binding RTX toxin-like protein
MMPRLGRRLLALSATVLVAGTPLAWSPPASAAKAMCQGEAATLVGSVGDRELTGTPGRDVVVTNSVREIDTGDGDDLICVTGHTRGPEIYAGSGDDVVDARRTRLGAEATLGDGADSFRGGSGADRVSTGTGDPGDWWRNHDDDRDTVSTGRGQDGVTSGDAYDPQVPNNDEIHLGPQHDFVYLHIGAGGVLQAHGGKDRDRMTILRWSTGDPVFYDNSQGRVWAGTGREPGTLRIKTSVGDFPHVEVKLDNSNSDRFRYEGTGRHERLELLLESPESYAEQPTVHGTISMRGGDDVVQMQDRQLDGTLRGGRGHDSFRTGIHATADERIRAELGGWISLAGRDLTRLRDLEDLRISADQADVTILGDDEANRLTAAGGTTLVRARKGADEISATIAYGGHGNDEVYAGREGHGGPGNDYVGGGGGSQTLTGDKGDDSLRGSRGDDVLRGGPGRDVLRGGVQHDKAYGGKGARDRCAAEVKRSCERWARPLN